MARHIAYATRVLKYSFVTLNVLLPLRPCLLTSLPPPKLRIYPSSSIHKLKNLRQYHSKGRRVSSFGCPACRQHNLTTKHFQSVLDLTFLSMTFYRLHKPIASKRLFLEYSPPVLFFDRLCLDGLLFCMLRKVVKSRNQDCRADQDNHHSLR